MTEVVMPVGGVIADIGGTNARFAWVAADGSVGEVWTCAVAGHMRFEGALAAYLARIGRTPAGVAIAAAGPVVAGSVQLTNAAWRISVEEVAPLVRGAPVRLVNDLEAVALGLPFLDRDATQPVVDVGSAGEYPCLAVNVGTGFGAALAVPIDSGKWIAVATEAGHISLDAAMLGLSDGVTVEDVFSGPGLARLRAAGTMQPADLRMAWSARLGWVVRDLIQATGAWGGVYLCGGLMDDFAALVDRDAFVGALHASGAMRARIICVPIRRIVASNPAFVGLANIVGGEVPSR